MHNIKAILLSGESQSLLSWQSFVTVLFGLFDMVLYLRQKYKWP